MYIIIIDTILSYYLLYKLKPHAYYYRVLLLNPLDVLCIIKYYLKPLLTRYKPLHLVLTYQLYTLLSKYLIYYISNLSLQGQESLHVKVKDILDNYLLFSKGKLLAIRRCSQLIGSTIILIDNLSNKYRRLNILVVYQRLLNQPI